MKTFSILLTTGILIISCQKSLDIKQDNLVVSATSSINGVKPDKITAKHNNKNTDHNMEHVTVDFSGFEFVPSYDWTMTFKRIGHPGETYIFKGNITDGYVHSKEMSQGSYDITLDTKTTAGASFIYFVFTKDVNTRLTNEINLELNYGDTTASQTVQELASYYMSTAIGR